MSRWTMVDESLFGSLRARYRALTLDPEDDGTQGSSFRAKGWLLTLGASAPLTRSERREVIASLFHERGDALPFARRFATLMSLSVALAVLGLLADSTAVVIGAMLVAPLMAPVLAIAASIVMGWPRRLIRNAGLLLVASVAGVFLAALISYLLPGSPQQLPRELMARTSPNLLDLGVGLAAGAAGAYAHVRRHASEAVAGAAVAVALVPPLAVVGISLQLGEADLAFGALMLFLANVSAIIFSGSLTFLLSGFVPGHPFLSGHARLAGGIRWAAIGLALIALSIQLGRTTLIPVTGQAAAVESFVEETEPTNSDVKIVEVSVNNNNGVAEVQLVLASAGPGPSVDVLAEGLARELGSPVDVELQVVPSSSSKASVTSP